MVKAPDIDQMQRDLEERIQIESNPEKYPFFKIGKCNLSKTSLLMRDYEAVLPKVFDTNDHSCFVIKKF